MTPSSIKKKNYIKRWALCIRITIKQFELLLKSVNFFLYQISTGTQNQTNIKLCCVERIGFTCWGCGGFSSELISHVWSFAGRSWTSMHQRLKSFNHNAHVWPEISLILHTQGSYGGHLFPETNQNATQMLVNFHFSSTCITDIVIQMNVQCMVKKVNKHTIFFFFISYCSFPPLQAMLVKSRQFHLGPCFS